jgi:hypothetical protein
MTAWIYPTGTEPGYAVIMSYRSPVSGTANGINLAPDASLGYHWNDNNYAFQSEFFPPVNQWSFVALVIAPTDTAIYMFNANGEQVANNAVSNPVQALNTPGHIGGDGNDPSFIGTIDEVAVFNQSLTQLQLTNMYSVAVTGVLPPPTVVLNITNSGGNVIVSWNPAIGSLLQAPSLGGPWTTNDATSPYTTSPTQTQM